MIIYIVAPPKSFRPLGDKGPASRERFFESSLVFGIPARALDPGGVPGGQESKSLALFLCPGGKKSDSLESGRFLNRIGSMICADNFEDRFDDST